VGVLLGGGDGLAVTAAAATCATGPAPPTCAVTVAATMIAAPTPVEIRSMGRGMDEWSGRTAARLR